MRRRSLRRPKSLGVATRPAPKWWSQIRLTITRARQRVVGAGDRAGQLEPAAALRRTACARRRARGPEELPRDRLAGPAGVAAEEDVRVDRARARRSAPSPAAGGRGGSRPARSIFFSIASIFSRSARFEDAVEAVGRDRPAHRRRAGRRRPRAGSRIAGADGGVGGVRPSRPARSSVAVPPDDLGQRRRRVGREGLEDGGSTGFGGSGSASGLAQLGGPRRRTRRRAARRRRARGRRPGRAPSPSLARILPSLRRRTGAARAASLSARATSSSLRLLGPRSRASKAASTKRAEVVAQLGLVSALPSGRGPSRAVEPAWRSRLVVGLVLAGDRRRAGAGSSSGSTELAKTP